MSLLAELFTWWNGQTIGTRIFTQRHGRKVGEDAQGNVYYQSADGARRWVIYNGYADASAIPPGWHGWMHHRTDVSPADESYKAREWEKAHRANPTGTAQAYRPPGSLAATGERPRVTGDYDAWTPGN